MVTNKKKLHKKKYLHKREHNLEDIYIPKGHSNKKIYHKII